MEYIHTKDLQSGLAQLQNAGGSFQRAAKSVFEIFVRISSGEADPFRGYKKTNKGESRLKHFVKYDLAGGCRLVTVVHADITILLIVSNHNEVDKWLDKNRGKEFVVDGSNNLVETLRPAAVRDEGKIEPVLEREMPGELSLLKRLDGAFADVLLGYN